VVSDVIVTDVTDEALPPVCPAAAAAAVIVSAPPSGGTAGAVYGMGRPFGHAVTEVVVIAGTAGTKGVVAVAGIAGIAGVVVKNPQPLLQTCQSTPALVASFTTAAFRFTVALA
jgi:hypothetical protein